jgi:hypothetical protein
MFSSIEFDRHIQVWEVVTQLVKRSASVVNTVSAKNAHSSAEFTQQPAVGGDWKAVFFFFFATRVEWVCRKACCCELEERVQHTSYRWGLEKNCPEKLAPRDGPDGGLYI